MAANANKTAILLELEKSLADKITEYARLDGRARVDLIREALNDYLVKRLNRTIAEEYAEGYGRIPDEADPWLTEAANQTFKDLPW